MKVSDTISYNRLSKPNLSFKANYITDITALQKRQDIFVPGDVSLVSIDPNNKQDEYVLKEVENNWDRNWCCSTIRIISQSVNPEKNNKKVLAVVKKNGLSASNLSYERILGLIAMDYTPFETKLSYIITIPEAISTEFNHIGTSFIEYLKTQTGKITLFCPDIDVIEQFYYKLGFKHQYPNNNKMLDFGQLYWERNSNFMEKIQLYFKSKIKPNLLHSKPIF